MIQIRCDDCERLFEVPEDQAGQKVACPYCGDVNRTAAVAAPAAPVAAVPVRAAVATPTVGQAMQPEAEQVIAVVRQAMFRAHPFWYSLMILIILAGAFLAFMGWQASRQAAPAGFRPWMMYAGLAMAAIGVLWWFGWWAAPHRWVKLTITNKRSIRQEGIVMRKTSEVLHRHVVNVTIRQGLMDRIFGVGYIGIDSAGQGGESQGDESEPTRRGDIEIEVANIPHPFRIKEIIDRYR